MSTTRAWLGFSLFMGVASAGACQPGDLEPCDGLTREACRTLLDPHAPDGGAHTGPADLSATPVPGCAKHATVAEVERDLLAVRCGKSACHVPGGVFAPDLKSPAAWQRLLDVPTGYANTHCPGDRYIAREDPAHKSYLFAVVKDAVPTCADGSPGGPRMPFARPALPDDELACLASYVQAVARARP
jgi:hypothetical protein